MSRSRPFYENVQAHYDLSDDFFALFLDPSRTYSCAYFAEPSYTLAQAQQAKIDLSLSKCDLQPGLKLLDIGCGWGATARRAAEKYGANVIGLTLSRNQCEHVKKSVAEAPPQSGTVEVRLQGWEEFDEPVDRIVSVGAFEHFRKARHREFFEKCFALLPKSGKMMLHTIVVNSLATQRRLTLKLTESDVAFARFILKYIFPGGELCDPERIIALAGEAGFTVTNTQSLQMDYAQTLDIWAQNLAAAKEQAVALTSQETYDTYMTYLTGCASQFRDGKIDVVQFSIAKD